MCFYNSLHQRRFDFIHPAPTFGTHMEIKKRNIGLE
jgi:hypothetical protein